MELNQNAMLRGAQLGFAIALLYGTSRRAFTIEAAHLWLWPAIELQQIQFLFDGQGGPLAYVTWAYLSPKNSERMRGDEVDYLHLSEWNEGADLWVIDVVAPFGHALAVLRAARRALPAAVTAAQGIRRDPSDRICRVAAVSW